MKNQIHLILLLFFFISISIQAQPFLKSFPQQGLSFKEMQLQFAEWKAHTDLSQAKGWKYFKRWEMDMQLHTDGSGNPVDPGMYVDELIRAADEKQMLSAARNNMTTWLPAGPFNLPANQTGYMENGIGRINCIAFHPTNPSTFFAGVAQGGLWKTTNNGQSWMQLTDNLPITRVSDIAIDANNPNTMYISLCDFEYIGVSLKLNGRKRNTHYGLGVYKTTDGGLTWQPTGLTFQLTQGDASLIRKIIVNPQNSNSVVACGASGMFTSSNGGATWTHILDSLFWDMVPDPVSPNILYAATGWIQNANDGNAAIYKSTDFGQTWTMLNTAIPSSGFVQRVKLAVAPSNPNYIYAITVDANNGFFGFYKSTDAGLTWQFAPPLLNILTYNDGIGTGGQGNYDLGLMVDMQNPLRVITGGINVWVSNDGATTFNPASHWTTSYGPSIHADIHSIDVHPLTGDIYVSSDGGLYRTSNLISQSWAAAIGGVPWPTVWTKLNSGMQVTSFYRLSSSKNANGKLMAGAQDNASFFYSNGVWNTIMGGDGMDNYIDPQNDMFVIGSSQYGNFNQSYDEGLTNFFINPNINGEAAEWTTPLIADYNQSGVLYAGYENVVQSTDNGDSWNVISNFPVPAFGRNEISALAVAATNSNVLYAARRVRYEFNIPGSVFMSLNGGNSWNNVTSGLPDSLYYTSVEINNANAATAYVSLGGLVAGIKVFKTTNNGNTWQNISFNLPNLPVNCIKSLPAGNAILAATDVGLYLLYSGSSTWLNVSAGLPNVILSDIEINQALDKIYVSTFGRGIWESQLSAITGLKEEIKNTADFDLYPTPSNGDITIQLNENGANIQLEIVDIMGRSVLKTSIKSGITKLHLTVTAGKYFAKVTNAKSVGVKAFLIQ
jgi:photosystem II stability/assembly factor-like uncharacterized protein